MRNVAFPAQPTVINLSLQTPLNLPALNAPPTATPKGPEHSAKADKPLQHNVAATAGIARDHRRGYPLHVNIEIDDFKLSSKLQQWRDELGTHLPGWKRQDRRDRSLAVATVHTLVAPLAPQGKVMVVLMASEHALKMPAASPWAREAWRAGPVAVGPMVLAPLARGTHTSWSWKFQERPAHAMAQHLRALVLAGDAAGLRHELLCIRTIYPLHGGIRRQVLRMLASAERLWTQVHCRTWPLADMAPLPALTRFQSERRT